MMIKSTNWIDSFESTVKNYQFKRVKFDWTSLHCNEIDDSNVIVLIANVIELIKTVINDRVRTKSVK